MSRSPALVALLLGTAALAERPAHAAAVEVSLDYRVEPASLACPDAFAFRKEVARQLGRNPFHEAGAPHHLMVRVNVAGEGLSGRIEWRDAGDRWEGERRFSSRSDGCAGMDRAMALATAIQIRLLEVEDQQAMPRPPAEPAATAAREPAAPSSSPAAPGAAAPEASPQESPTPAQPEPPAPPPPPPVEKIAAAPEQTAPAQTAAPGPRLALEVGAGIIKDAGDAPLFTTPRLALSWQSPWGVHVRLAASGLGPGAEVSGAEGTARLDRAMMTLGLVHFFRDGDRLQPMLSAGLGWHRIHVQGTSLRPDLGAAHDGQSFSGLATLGGGVALAVAGGLSVLLEVEGLGFVPPATVKIGTNTAASLKGVAAFARGGFLARF